MPDFFFIFFLLVVLSSAPIVVPIRLNERILHQPFVPEESLTPPPAPSPPNPTPPKYPFSDSNTTSPDSPFFPSYPSPPPAPAAPATAFASFPANISSLIVPKAQSRSTGAGKLIAVTISAVLASVLVSAAVLFFYRRRRHNRNFPADDDEDDKSYIRSEHSNRLFQPPPIQGQSFSGTHKLRTASSTSSEFLYLGTLVSSHGLDDRDDSRVSSTGLETRKVDSPDLQPLPPLARQTSRLSNYENAEPGTTRDDDEDEEEEEFYSPRGSSGGRESFNGTGSESMRVLEAVAGSETTSCSCSSSDSGSPSRSHSISLSPPVSLSPNRRSQEPKPLEHPAAAPYAVAILRSPSLSPMSSPERAVEEDLPVSDRNGRSPSVSSFSSSPERVSEKNPDASSKVSDQISPIPSPKGSAFLDRIAQSPSPSSTRSSSPERESIGSDPKAKSLSSDSPTSSIASDRGFINLNPKLQSRSSSSSSSLSTSPDRELGNNSDNIAESPVGLGSGLKQAFSAPPPPPPMPPSLRLWESLSSRTPVGQVITGPPALIPPSRPFVLQNPAKDSVSPVELPASFEPSEPIEETPKPKLKPLHWDKVRASSDREMVWDQLRSSSFKLNEEMIETLFVVKTPNPNPKETTPRAVLPSPKQDNRVLDPKKSQNIAIALRALNVTIEEVCEALSEGNSDALGTELLESLLKMAPTKEEERKLREYKDDSPVKLGPAEKFLKALLDVPFAFKRINVMLYMTNFESEIDYLKKSFETLEAACEELRNSRMFLKLLEAVLKTGNRMNVGTNRGDAHAFKLDTLLKLVDVKGADGKTTLLHFVVQEIIRTEGARLTSGNQTSTQTLSDDAKCRRLGLEVVSGLSSALTSVKKAAAMDSDVLSSDVAKLSEGIRNIEEVVRLNETAVSDESRRKFSESMNMFMEMGEEQIIRLQAQESVALSLVKEITEYFHGNSTREEAHPFRIFMVVRDFLTILDRVCKEVGMINERTIVSTSHKFPVPVNPMMPQIVPVNPMLLPQLLPGHHGRPPYNSSDDESTSP